MEDIRYMDYDQIEKIVENKMKTSFLYMFFALLITFGIAFSTLYSLNMVMFVYKFYSIILIAEVIVAIAFGALSYRANASTLSIFLLIYSVLTGFTLSALMLIFTPESIISILVSVVALFLVLSIYAYKTEKSFYSWGRMLSIVLIAVLITSIVNIFLGIAIINTAISAVISVLMMAYIVYDVNTIKNNILLLVSEGQYDLIERVQIVGAFALYLDFINLFISLLRIFGKRK